MEQVCFLPHCPQVGDNMPILSMPSIVQSIPQIIVEISSILFIPPHRSLSECSFGVGRCGWVGQIRETRSQFPCPPFLERPVAFSTLGEHGRYIGGPTSTNSATGSHFSWWISHHPAQNSRHGGALYLHLSIQIYLIISCSSSEEQSRAHSTLCRQEAWEEVR